MPNWYDTYKSAQSDGTLPNTKTAKKIRYRKSIIWTIDLGSLGINGNIKNFEWTIEIDNIDGSQRYFKQTVGLQLFLVSLGASGIELFTWNYVKDTFDTTAVAGVPTTKDTIGQFLQGGTALSEQGDLQPASGQDSTDLTATIITDWYSPIYLLKEPGRQLPTGYRFTKSRDTGGVGNLQSTYQFAFEDGTPASLGSLIDPLGSLITARGAYDGERIFTGRAWGGKFENIEAGAAIKGTAPTLHRLRDGRLILAIQTVEGVVEMVSRGGVMGRFERLGYPTPSGALVPSPVFGKDATMPVSLLLPNQDRLHLAVEGASLYSRVVDKTGVTALVYVGAAGDGAYSLEREPAGALVIIGSDGKPKWRSKGIPLRWVLVK